MKGSASSNYHLCETIREIVANPEELFSRADSLRLGGGNCGEVRLVSSRAGGVIVKKGLMSETELKVLKKLEGLGVAPVCYGFKETEKRLYPLLEGYMTISKAKGIPAFLCWTQSNGIDVMKGVMDSYLALRKAIHLKGIAHNDMHGFNFFYDKETKKGMLVDFGLAKDDPKAALIEALGTGKANPKDIIINTTGKTGGDWQSFNFIRDLSINSSSKGEHVGANYKKFISNRVKVRRLLKQEVDGPALMAKNITDRTDDLPGMLEAKALEFIKMLYE